MSEIIEFYISIRGSLFTGFLTAGSFLLTMKVFMITTMKEKYYDQPFYDKILAQHQENDPKIDRHDKLHEFRRLLKASIYCCYLTSLVQLIIGPFIFHTSMPGTVPVTYSGYSNLLTVICMATAILTLILVVFCIHALSGNMKMYVKHSKKP